MIKKNSRCLVLAKVRTDGNFSHGAFFREVLMAWNLMHDVPFQTIGPNLFIVQFFSLGDWERIMHDGP